MMQKDILKRSLNLPLITCPHPSLPNRGATTDEAFFLAIIALALCVCVCVCA